MKREYFAMLVMLTAAVLIIGAGYLFGDEVVAEKLHHFIIVWLVLAFYLGQYSTKFPKAF